MDGPGTRDLDGQRAGQVGLVAGEATHGQLVVGPTQGEVDRADTQEIELRLCVVDAESVERGRRADLDPGKDTDRDGPQPELGLAEFECVGGEVGAGGGVLRQPGPVGFMKRHRFASGVSSSVASLGSKVLGLLVERGCVGHVGGVGRTGGHQQGGQGERGEHFSPRVAHPARRKNHGRA